MTVALCFVLARNLLKLFAERRMGVLGSKFRTRMVAGALLLSFVPVMVMYWFAYGLMNRSIDKWLREATATLDWELFVNRAGSAREGLAHAANKRKPARPRASNRVKGYGTSVATVSGGLPTLGKNR